MTSRSAKLALVALITLVGGGCAPRATDTRQTPVAPTQRAAASTAPRTAALAQHRIAAGEGHTCVIRADESVWCWGRDSLGQDARDTKPAAVPELQGVRGLAARDVATCALTKQGVVCWGDNLFGQLSMPPAIQYRRIPELRILDDSRLAQDAALGPQAACDLTRDTVSCWGEIGSSIVPSSGTRFGTIATSAQGKNAITGSRTTTRRPIPEIAGAVQVAIGASHLCALMPDRSVRCLGNNSLGQLGRIERETADAYPAAPVTGLADVLQIEAGQVATCARTTHGAVYCWGSDYFSQLGVRDDTKLLPERHYVTIPDKPHERFWPLPLRVENLPKVHQLTVGGTHVCAIGDDRRVYCWGMNAAGQLGDGTTERRAIPVMMAGITGAVDVAASSYGPESHTCVLLESGKVQCVGRNKHGELGRRGGEVELTPGDVEGL